MTTELQTSGRRHRAAGFDPAPTWHELVQAPDTHNRPDPSRTLARREKLGQVVPYTGVIVKQEGTGVSRAQRRAVGNRQTSPGRLVLHRTRLHPVDGGPRPDVERRRAERAARKASA